MNDITTYEIGKICSERTEALDEIKGMVEWI